MPRRTSRPLDTHTLRRLAVEACRDPRTVVAALEGRATAPATAAVMAAIDRLGLDADALVGRGPKLVVLRGGAGDDHGHGGSGA